jgi:hypothetical protein
LSRIASSRSSYVTNSGLPSRDRLPLLLLLLRADCSVGEELPLLEASSSVLVLARLSVWTDLLLLLLAEASPLA